MHPFLTKPHAWILGTLLLTIGCQSTSPKRAASDRISGTIASESMMQHQVGDHQLRYLIQYPVGTPPKEGWPLLLFLHGYGECGDELEKVKKHGPPKLIGQFRELQEAVVLSPQCPSDSWWRTDALRALVEEVVQKRGDINRERLYVTGLSMGGYGTWSFISRHPDFFAAAVPICGGGDPFRLPANRPPEKTGIVNEFDPQGLKQVTDLPVWTFHGSEDTSVPILETERMVDLLKQGDNSDVRFTTFVGVGHVGAWELAYANPELWEWLFSQ